MSWKSLVCAGLLCGFLVVPAMAQPSVIVDLVRDGSGRPVLDANGNWQFSVSVDPDETFFEADPGGGAPGEGNRGVGGAVATDFGLSVTSTNNGATGNDVGSVVISLDPAYPHAGGFTNGTTEDSTGSTVLRLNFGNSPFAGLADCGGNLPAGCSDGVDDGVQSLANQLTAFLGSTYWLDANGGGARELFTFSAGKPATDNANGDLSIEVTGSGAFSGAGRVSQVDPADPQNNSNFDNVIGSLFSALVNPGDANFDGNTDGGDLTVLGQNFNQTGIWTNADFTGDGNVDGSDLTVLGQNFNTGSGVGPGIGGGSIPEPASALLILLGAIMAALVRRR